MISLVLCTYRPGGLDIFAQSFCGDMGGEYEVVVVDDHPGRVERGEARKYLEGRGIPVGWYGGSKPKSYPHTKGGLANAMNTALIHARGDYLVWVCDYTRLPHYWLKQWQAVQGMHPPKTLVSGGGIVYHVRKPDILGDVLTWGEPVSLSASWPWVAREFETFYWGGPIEFLLAINGVDERADHCHCWPVSSKVAQAKALGYSLAVEPDITAHIVDHRIWDSPEEPNPLGNEGLWKITAAQSLSKEPDWTVPSPNPFDIRQLRREAGNG